MLFSKMYAFYQMNEESYTGWINYVFVILSIGIQQDQNHVSGSVDS